MLSVLEIEENLFLRNTYTRYHICLMHMFILFLSIYPVQCVSIIIQYNITTSSSTAVYLTLLVIVQNITTLLLLLCIWCTAVSQLCTSWFCNHRAYISDE